MAKATEPQPRILRVTSAFACDLGEFLSGELVDADHPAARKYADHFAPLVIHHTVRREATIEQATAAPGEKRGA
jgi:hypothetical protein